MDDSPTIAPTGFNAIQSLFDILFVLLMSQSEVQGGREDTLHDTAGSHRQPRSAADDHRCRRQSDLRKGSRAPLGADERFHVQTDGASEGKTNRKIGF